jgi:hypothetical protein
MMPPVFENPQFCCATEIPPEFSIQSYYKMLIINRCLMKIERQHSGARIGLLEEARGRQAREESGQPLRLSRRGPFAGGVKMNEGVRSHDAYANNRLAQNTSCFASQ